MGAGVGCSTSRCSASISRLPTRTGRAASSTSASTRSPPGGLLARSDLRGRISSRRRSGLIRWGQRLFALRHGPVLDYGGVGPLSPSLTGYEQEAIARLTGNPGLLGLAEILPDDRAAALHDRVLRMERAQEILPAADF